MLKNLKSFRLRLSGRLVRCTSSAQKPCAPCPPGVESNAQTRVDVFDNGVRVATEERVSSPLACLSLVTGGGPRHEAACNNGVFHFIEHVAFSGFKSLTKEALEKNLLEKTASLSVTTRRETQTFTALGAAASYEQLFEYLAKVITDLQPSEQVINEVTKKIDVEALDAEGDPKKLCFDYLHQCAFQGTALAQRIIGPSCNYELFRDPFLKEFMSCHYQPWRILVASSGAVNHKKMLSLAQTYFGNLKPTQCQPTFSDNRYTGSSVIYRDDSLPFAHVAIAVEAPGYCDEDYFTMLVAKNMVGSWDRSQPGGRELANPLARAIADSNSCHLYEAFYLAYKDVGLWGIYFVGQRMELENTVYLVQDHWMKMCTMITDNELKAAVNSTMLDLGKRYDGVMNSCKDIGKQVFYTGQRLEYAQAASKVVGMKASSLREVMMEAVYDKCPVVAAVGPTENLPDYTRIRAGMYWLRL